MATGLNDSPTDPATIALGEINKYDFRTDAPAVFKKLLVLTRPSSQPAESLISAFTYSFQFFLVSFIFHILASNNLIKIKALR